MATPQLLSRATPWRGWDLETLLDHLSDSIGVVGEAIATGGVAAPTAPGHPGPVARLRGQAARLLAVCAAAWPAERLVAIRDREPTTSLAVLAGAIEITATCGTSLPRAAPPGRSRRAWRPRVAAGRCAPGDPGQLVVKCAVAHAQVPPGQPACHPPPLQHRQPAAQGRGSPSGRDLFIPASGVSNEPVLCHLLGFAVRLQRAPGWLGRPATFLVPLPRCLRNDFPRAVHPPPPGARHLVWHSSMA